MTRSRLLAPSNSNTSGHTPPAGSSLDGDGNANQANAATESIFNFTSQKGLSSTSQTGLSSTSQTSLSSTSTLFGDQYFHLPQASLSPAPIYTAPGASSSRHSTPASTLDGEGGESSARNSYGTGHTNLFTPSEKSFTPSRSNTGASESDTASLLSDQYAISNRSSSLPPSKRRVSKSNRPLNTAAKLPNCATSAPPEPVQAPSRPRASSSTIPTIFERLGGASTPVPPLIAGGNATSHSSSPPPPPRLFRGASEPPAAASDSFEFTFEASRPATKKPQDKDPEQPSQPINRSKTPMRSVPGLGTRIVTKSASISPAHQRDGGIDYLAADMGELKLNGEDIEGARRFDEASNWFFSAAKSSSQSAKRAENRAEEPVTSKHQAGARHGAYRDVTAESLTDKMRRVNLQGDDDAPAEDAASSQSSEPSEYSEYSDDGSLEVLFRVKRDLGEFLRKLETELSSATRRLEPPSLPPFVDFIRQRAIDLKKICSEKQEDVKVAFLGVSGHGKSSLINSLLGKREIAPSAGDGHACTSVLTHYRACRGIDGNFAVEVKFISKSQWLAEAKEILRSIKAYDSMTEEERCGEVGKGIGEQRKSGIEKLKLLFPQIDMEQVNKREMQYIEKLTSGLDRTAKLFEPHGGAHRKIFGETIYAKFSDERSFTKALRKISITNPHNNLRAGALYPIMLEANVYVNSSLLENGLVLVDLPGQLDVNKARAAVAIDALRTCEEIVVVSTFDRVETATSLTKIFEKGVLHQIKQYGLQRLSVAITKCDIFTVDNATLVEKWGRKLGITEEDLERMSTADRRKIRGRALRLRNSATQDAVRKNLGDQLREINPDNHLRFELDVFCVSSLDYDCLTHGKMGSLEDHVVRCTGREDTGIPSLQKHCMNMVDKRLRHKLCGFLNGDCMPFLDDLMAFFDNENYLDDLEASGISSQEILDALETMKENLRNKVSETIGSLRAPLEDLIAISETCTWESCDKCGEIADRWQLHHLTFWSVCENNGCFRSSGAAGLVDWNSDLLEEYRPLVRAWTRRFDEFMNRPLWTRYKEELLEVFQGGILGDKHVNDRTTINQIKTALSKIEDLLKQKERSIRCKFSQPAGPSSLMGKLMSDAYEACLEVAGGRGVTRRQRVAIQNEVRDRGPRAYRLLHNIIEDNVDLEILCPIQDILEEMMKLQIQSIDVVYLQSYRERLNHEEANIQCRRKILGRLQRAGMLDEVENMTRKLNAALENHVRSPSPDVV